MPINPYESPLEVNEPPEEPRNATGDSELDPLGYIILAIAAIKIAVWLLSVA
jgi:hypothetical protein